MQAKAIILSLLYLIPVTNYAQQEPINKNYIIKTHLLFWDSVKIKITCENETLYSDSFFGKQIVISGRSNGTKDGYFILRKGGFTVTVPFYIEPGTITIRDFGKNNTGFEISGTLNNDLRIRFYKDLDSLFPFKLLMDGKLTEKQFHEDRRRWAECYIKRNRNSIILPSIYKELFLNADISDKEKFAVFKLLASKVRSSFAGMQVASELKDIGRTIPKKLSPTFILQDPNGRMVSLKEFRGKYVLLDFWASWCQPCRAQNPLLKNIFERYKDKNFQIVSISLDTDRERWLNAIKEDSLPWIQISDLIGWTGETALAYHIISIPANLFLSPEGMILDKNLAPVDLEKKLSILTGDKF